MQRRAFMPHQKECWRLIRTSRVAGLFLEMRLGKTLLAIRWLRTRQIDTALIVCPSAVMHTWQTEFAAEGLDCCLLRGPLAKRYECALEAMQLGARFFVTNYEGLYHAGHKTANAKPKLIPTDLALHPWGAVVADESTKLKDPNSLTSKVFVKVLSQAKYRCIMSGLPNPESDLDFVQQLMFLRGSVLGCSDYWTFRQRHCITPPVGKAYLKRVSREPLVREVANMCVAMKRKDAGVGNVKLYAKRYVALPAKIKKAIAAAQKDMQVGNILLMNELGVIGSVMQMCGGAYAVDGADLRHNAKLNELKYLLRTELRWQQALVWCRHTAEIAAVAAMLSREKILCAQVHGGTRATNDESIEAFRRGATRVLVVQSKCLQMGVDLSAASASIYLSNYHAFEIRAQSEDRIVHPKKVEPSLIIDIVAENTIDEDVAELLTEKAATSGTFMSKLRERMLERVAGC